MFDEYVLSKRFAWFYILCSDLANAKLVANFRLIVVKPFGWIKRQKPLRVHEFPVELEVFPYFNKFFWIFGENLVSFPLSVKKIGVTPYYE